jgi:hypothetical protein
MRLSGVVAHMKIFHCELRMIQRRPGTKDVRMRRNCLLGSAEDGVS